ncbi:MAG TPA: LLM class flavin-dependent oxidoreductase [Solirubrobacteraceae bacterium]|jgi:alkanesulfonate monooxygenase|nr:LLM class flavin-dependent oxidoreductase [Solirubrobacteraceae bacterium]
MGIKLHWYLPTHGDGRTLLLAGDSSQTDLLTHSRPARAGHRPPTLAYLGQVARAAEQSGFDAALTPTGTWCDDAWITCAALSQMTERLRFLVAFRPGGIHPTLAAQQVATFQRHSGGRLLLNIVTGGNDVEQRRFGDDLDKDERYARTDEFLTILRGALNGEPFSFRGRHLWADGATALAVEHKPDVYFGGSSDAALRVAARNADVYLTWGEPPPQLEQHLERLRQLADEAERELRYGVRLHVVSRDTAERAWADAVALIADADEQAIAEAQTKMTHASATGQQRMQALHRGSRDDLEVYPNLWAGPGLLRGGAGTALVGSHAQVADRIAEYHELGIEEFILSGYPHVEEAYAFGEGVLPVLRERGLVEELAFEPAT